MYKTYGIIIPNSFSTWKPTVTQKHTLTGSNGRLKKFWWLWIQRNGHAIRMYIWSIQKHYIPLTISAISGLSSVPLSSLMFMADTRMEDAGTNFLKEVLIRCCQKNLNPLLTIIVKQKRNVASKVAQFIQNPIMHPHFSYLSSKKE